MNEFSEMPNPHDDNFHEFMEAHHGEILNAPATERNYALRTDWSDNPTKMNIILRSNENNTTVNLVDLLPEGWKFHGWTNFEAQLGEKIVQFDFRRLQNKGFVLSTLHEIAHARQGIDVKPIGSTIKDMSFSEKLKFAFETAIKTALVEARKEMAIENKTFDPALYTLPEAVLPSSINNKIYEKRAQAERNAWAEALQMSRQLERQGFNVLGEFKGPAEVKAYIDFCLATYEFALSSSQKVFGLADEKTNLFIKKRKSPSTITGHQ